MTDMFLVMACPWVIFGCHVFVSLIYETSMVILCSVMDGCYSTGGELYLDATCLGIHFMKRR